jgi:hypothetical protein
MEGVDIETLRRLGGRKCLRIVERYAAVLGPANSGHVRMGPRRPATAGIWTCDGGRWWDRTTGLLRVEQAFYR